MEFFSLLYLPKAQAVRRSSFVFSSIISPTWKKPKTRTLALKSAGTNSTKGTHLECAGTNSTHVSYELYVGIVRITHLKCAGTNGSKGTYIFLHQVLLLHPVNSSQTPTFAMLTSWPVSMKQIKPLVYFSLAQHTTRRVLNKTLNLITCILRTCADSTIDYHSQDHSCSSNKGFYRHS